MPDHQLGSSTALGSAKYHKRKRTIQDELVANFRHSRGSRLASRNVDD
ncbi:MAG: hypothetical protein ABI877_12655 [Gemmatimonadaceae bacterium]